MKTSGDLRDLQFEEICWNWNCCRFTWQVFEESPESTSHQVGGLFGGTSVIGLITEPLGFVQDARDVMVLFGKSIVFVCWTSPLQDDACMS